MNEGGEEAGLGLEGLESSFSLPSIVPRAY
jgi:hypothetical protein